MLTSKLARTIILSLFLFITAFYYISTGDDNDAVDCSSAFSIINDKRTLSLSVTFSAYNGNGLMTFTGNSDGTEDNISIRKYFSYEKNRNNIYVFKNHDSEIRLPPLTSEETFSTFLPDFFTGVNKRDEFIVKIIKLKEGTWLFMSTNTPYFICENTTARAR